MGQRKRWDGSKKNIFCHIYEWQLSRSVCRSTFAETFTAYYTLYGPTKMRKDYIVNVTNLTQLCKMQTKREHNVDFPVWLVLSLNPFSINQVGYYTDHFWQEDYFSTDWTQTNHMGNVKRNGVFEHAQNTQIQIHPTHAQSLIRVFALHWHIL